MAIITTDQIQLNDIIRFKTLSPHDNTLWMGEVVSLCDYDVAILFGTDIVNYYQDINRNISGSLAAKETLTYFILKTSETDSDGNTVSVNRVFAFDFVDVSTLERIAEQTYYTIRVYDITSDKIDDLCTAINAMGYIVDIVDNGTVGSLTSSTDEDEDDDEDTSGDNTSGDTGADTTGSSDTSGT